MKKIIFFTIFFFSLFNIFSRPQINEQNSFCLMGNVLFYEKPDFSVPYKYRSLNHEGGVKLTVLEKGRREMFSNENGMWLKVITDKNFYADDETLIPRYSTFWIFLSDTKEIFEFE